MKQISTTSSFEISDLGGNPREKSVLLISPPVYDTQYWAQWSQPYGLLRIATHLRQQGYRRIELFDFMEVQPEERIHQHRINPGESFAEKDQPERPIQPHRITKPGDPNTLDLYYYHFGKTWREFESWLDEHEMDSNHPPNEIWISAVMTYWWESVRDLIIRLRRRYDNRTNILLGGIYPTLAPEHALRFCKPDIVVVGEVKAANDLWTDLSLYRKPPNYAILTPGRGCPNNCAYCAQKTINGGRRQVQFRSPDDVFAEMQDKWQRFGIRDFAFYADYLLWNHENNFEPLLDKIINHKEVQFRIYAPEGLDVRVLAGSPQLAEKLKAARLQKLYLPCESINDEHLNALNRKHVRLEHFVKAVSICQQAGFELRNLEVNAFLLYGLPGETVDQVVKSILFVSEIVGSIIPMLFTPVPSSQVYEKFLPYIQERGWDKDLHMLNGKLFPFMEYNEGSVSDYVDMQRLMFTLNAHYRNSSFQVFGSTRVASAFRHNLNNGFEGFIERYRISDTEETGSD